MKTKRSYKFWCDEEDKRLISLLDTMAINEVAVILDRSCRAVQARITDLGIARGHEGMIMRRLKAQRQYCVDDNFFNTPNYLSCYWAGFIAADGNIISGRRNRISVEIHQKDLTHLQCLAKDIDFQGPIRNVQKNCVKLQFSSRQMKDDLNNNFNITPCKSLTLIPPPLVDNALIKSFITGYIDGDGWIIHCKPKGLGVGVCGTYDMLMWIKTFFDNHYPNSHSRIANVNSKDLYFQYEIYGKRGRAIIEDLSQLDVPKLKRKWEIISCPQAL